MGRLLSKIKLQKKISSFLFGTAGVPRSSPGTSTISGLETLKELRLDCLEIEFVQKVSIGEETAKKIRKKAEELRLPLSIHSPYYINLNSHDPEKLIASRKRLKDAAKAAFLLGATDVVFHPGFYQGDSPEHALKNIKGELLGILEELKNEEIFLNLRPETTGKHNQFGSLEETIRLVKEVGVLKPCLDFAHLHARKPYKGKRDFLKDLERVGEVLGEGSLKEMHIHLSGIRYSKSGEVNHLNFSDSDFPYGELLEALYVIGASGRIICESPNLEGDALLLKKKWSGMEKADFPDLPV